MKRFAVLTWSHNGTLYPWSFELAGNLPALLDGLCLFLTKVNG